MLEMIVRLLITAGFLMLIAGCIFGFIGQWFYAALVWIGAFDCCIAAMNFRNKKDKQIGEPERSMEPGRFKMIQNWNQIE